MAKALNRCLTDSIRKNCCLFNFENFRKLEELKMLNNEKQTITKEIDISVLDEEFYIAILNKILELKKLNEEQNALRSKSIF